MYRRQGADRREAAAADPQNQQLIKDIIRRIEGIHEEKLVPSKIARTPRRHRPKLHSPVLPDARQDAAQHLSGAEHQDDGLMRNLSRKQINQHLNHAINALKVSSAVSTPEKAQDLQEIQMM